MPKNNYKPSFKHYISKSIQVALGEEGHGHNDPNGREEDGASVVERLSRSRAEAGPSRPRGNGGWNTVQSQPLGAWDEEDRPVVVPVRRVAGPAAPPSWRTIPTSTTAASKSQVNPDQGITRQQLIQASSLLSRGRIIPPPKLGVPSLTEYVFRTVIRYLDCEEVCWIDEDESTTSYGEFLRREVADYDIRFKMGILAAHSSHPTPRLSDKTIRSLLEPPGYSHDTIDTGNDDWDEGPLMPMVHHLSITLHPTPHRLLKLINPLPNLALTSLDLTYSTIPIQIEKFVSALPIGLRELGLAGVRCSSEKDFTKMLILLGRRLMLLHVSHLHPLHDMTSHKLTSSDP